MFNEIELSKDRQTNYAKLLETVPFYLERRDPLVSNLSNLSALLNYFLDEINWVGFYLFEKDSLYLGPFQGYPACTKITLGQGVCGTSAKTQETVIVDDVTTFPGHIFCDAASRSEIVVPMVKNDVLIGVLDVDAPKVGRFDSLDQNVLEKVVRALVDILE